VAGSVSAIAGAIDQPFDIILAISVLEYQAKPHEVVSDLVRLLRPKSFLVMSVPNERSLVRVFERPIDALAARVGRIVGNSRLADRAYSATRPFGSKVPWVAALASAGAVCTDIVPLPLGDSGLRRLMRPNLLVVAQSS
jgi:SAM-dependent methyltransferase